MATVILRDITERKAAERALAESRSRLEGIVASAMDAVLTVDEAQRIILFNPAAERMFGAPAAEALGAPLERFIPERHRAGHAEHIRLFKETGVTSRRMGALGAVSGLRANGEEFPLEASISQVQVGGAQLSTVILRDITTRQATEEARLLLAREVDHRAKNALAVVQAVVSLTRAATKEAFVEAVRGRISALGRAHALLAQSGWQGGRLGQVIADETGGFGRPGQIDIDCPPVLLNANAVQPVSLLIHELATNAVKYGALSVEDGRVMVGAKIMGAGELAFRWTETGGPRVTAPVGRGFGSTLIHQVATRQLGGRLDMSWAAEGLDLTVVWPAGIWRARAEGSEPAAAEDRAPALARSDAGRVLVVEDESLIAMELGEALALLGWTVVGPAANVQEALRLIDRTRDLDAAVLDINLGGELVYPVAERLQARGIPFLFCTGYERPHHDGRFGDAVIVRKPVNARILTRELDRLGRAA